MVYVCVLSVWKLIVFAYVSGCVYCISGSTWREARSRHLVHVAGVSVLCTKTDRERDRKRVYKRQG